MSQYKLQPLYLGSHNLMFSALTTAPLSLLALVFQSSLGCFCFFLLFVLFCSVLSFSIAYKFYGANEVHDKIC